MTQTTTQISTTEIRLDGWVDAVKGFSGKRTSQYEGGRVAKKDLSDLYDTDWLARRIVDIVPDFVFKGGVNFSDPKLLEIFNEANESFLNPRGNFAHAMSMARLHEGSVLVVLPERAGELGAAEPWKPSDGWRHVLVERFQDLSIEYDVNPMSRTVNRPLFYKLSKHPFSGVRVHASRCLVFAGLPRANPTKEHPWVSILEPCFDTLANYGFSWASVSNLIKESSIMWLRMKGLVEGIAKAGSGVDDTVKGRLKFMSQTKSVNNMLYLDIDEECGRLDVSFADLPQLMQELAMQLCGASNIPATLLFGRSPAGMNATGESDFQNFRTNIQENRDNDTAPKISKFCELLTGKRPVKVTFGDLDTPTAEQAEARRKSRFEADRILWEMEGLDALQIIHARIKDGTLGINLPEELITRIEEAVKNSKKQNTLDVSITDVPFFVRVNEARAAKSLEADPVNGDRLIAEVRQEIESRASELPAI